MSSVQSSESVSDEESEYLDPRIQIELERLNTCTDEINRLETELDEANTTFRMLLNESMRRLKLLTVKLGSCIDRARPYYEAVDIAKKAQAECQRAAVKFQRANEIHQAAKETVALAETRFLSNQHEWQFDSAWQEMLNHAIIKVTEAEHQRTESGQEHQKRATLFNVAEQRVATLEHKLKRTIIKSRPYFEEKSLCQEQLDTQKKRVDELQVMISKVKADYSNSLKRLEAISEEIHQKRRNKLSGTGSPLPRGPREPGVGAELDTKLIQEDVLNNTNTSTFSSDIGKSSKWPRDELESELDKFESCSIGTISHHTSSHVSESEDYDDDDLDELRQKVKELSMAEVRSDTWETELAESILRLDNAMLERECSRELREIAAKPSASPFREQDCNRELTAIVARSESVDCAKHPTPVSSIKIVRSCSVDSADKFVNETVNERIRSDSSDKAKQGADTPSKTIGKSMSADSAEHFSADTSNSTSENSISKDYEVPYDRLDAQIPHEEKLIKTKVKCENLKLLDTVLAEEEKKRRSKESFPKIEQLSAVALNQMVNDKDVLLNNNTPRKSLNLAKSDSLSSDYLDNSQWILPGLEPLPHETEVPNSDRRQSIGAAARELLNNTKIESLKINLNENILHTIKDVSESVINRLVRQDSKTEVTDKSWHHLIPFKSNDDKLRWDDSVVQLKPNDSVIQPHSEEFIQPNLIQVQPLSPIQSTAIKTSESVSTLNVTVEKPDLLPPQSSHETDQSDIENKFEDITDLIKEK